MTQTDSRRPARSLALALTVAIWGWSCAGDASAPAGDAGGAPASRQAPARTEPVPAPASGPRDGAGGLSWAAPGSWTAQGAQGMRAATYAIPAAAGAGPAEMAVFYFGAGQGGDTEANIQRWIGQFRGADGGPAQEVRRGARTIGALQVTTLEAKGAYGGSGGPMMGGGDPQPGYAMLAAIVEGPQGPVFFKLTGPEATVEGARAAFEGLLASISLEPNA